jgi:hypothetical protein
MLQDSAIQSVVCSREWPRQAPPLEAVPQVSDCQSNGSENHKD